MFRKVTPLQWLIIVPAILYGLWVGILVVPNIVKIVVPAVVKAVTG